MGVFFDKPATPTIETLGVGCAGSDTEIRRLIAVAAPLIFDNFKARRVAANIAKLPELARKP